MKRIFLTAVVLAFSLASLAEQPKAVVQKASDSLVMTAIEDKNQNIMSSYKDYSRLRQQNKLLKQNRIQQQYSQFVEGQSISSSTASR